MYLYVTFCCAQKLPHVEHEALIRALANKIHGRVSKADVLFELAQQIRKCALMCFYSNFKQYNNYGRVELPKASQFCCALGKSMMAR